MNFSKIKNKIKTTLIWSQKYTKTDMVYLAKGGFWITSGQIMSMLVSFVVSILFARLITQENYGVYKYILSIAGLLTISTLTGMNTATTQAVARGHDGSFIKSLKAKMEGGLLGLVIGLGVAFYYYFKGAHNVAYALIIASAFIPLMDPVWLYNSFLNGRKEFKLSTKYSTITQITTSSLLLITLVLTKNILGIILIYFLSNTLLRVYFLLQTLRKHKLNNSEDPTTIKFGLHLSATEIIGKISGNLDSFILWHFLGPVQLAIYSFAYAPINQISGLLKFIQPLAFPKLATNTGANLKKTLPHKIIIFSFITLGITALYILITPYFYNIFFPNYNDSIVYSRYLAIILLFFPQKLIGFTLQAQAQTRALYIFSVSNSIIRIILQLILIPIYGLTGAVIASILPYLYGSVLQIYYFKKL